MVRYFKLYFILLSQNIQSKMEYKLDFVLGNVTALLGQVIGIAFVWVIFQQIRDLNGWTLPQIMLIYGIAALPYGLFELFFNGLWRLNYYIRMGDFDWLMFRPVEPLIFILGDETATHGLGNVLMGMVIIVKASMDLSLKWNLVNIGFAFVIAICGTIIYVSINMVTATLSFWFVGSRSSVMFMVQRLRDFSRYPIDIYSMPIQILLTWIVPFAFTGFFPATFLLGRQEFSSFVFLTPFVSIVFFILAYAFWRLGLNKYESTGS